jgi:hypothetical protein
VILPECSTIDSGVASAIDISVAVMFVVIAKTG